LTKLSDKNEFKLNFVFKIKKLTKIKQIIIIFGNFCPSIIVGGFRSLLFTDMLIIY